MSKTLLFASCDVVYFKKYAKSFVNSAVKYGNYVHVHIINPEVGLERVENKLVTYSFEEKSPDTREYYASNRFHVAPEILASGANVDMKLLILDIDCVIREHIQLPDADVALYMRESFGANDWEREGTRIAAGAVMYDSKALPFACRVSDMLMGLPQYWFVDQVALARVMDEFDGILTIEDLSLTDPPLLDWEFRDNGIIWTAKGDRKSNVRFLEEQEKYL